MRILENLGLSFDDVAMIPQYSCVESRSDVDLTMKLYTSDPEVIYSFDLPVISSPMSTVTEDEMAFRMYINGGLGIIHRFNTIEEQVALVESAHKKYEKFYYDIGAPLQNFSNSDFICGAAIGATGDYIERCQALIQAGVKIICVDIAHGNHLIMKEALTELKKIIPKHIHIMASSVADANGFMNFEIWGAHSARIGISSGGNCSTFLATGHGLPTFQSLIDCRKFRFNPKFGLIADGGMRYPGDIVKSFGAGATMCILGSMLAGTKAAPGHIIKTDDGRWTKEHRGSASEANQKLRGIKNPKVEGVSALVPYKGKVENVLQSIKDGLQSGCSYSGVWRLEEMHAKAIFQQITQSGYIQGTPHILTRK